MPTHPSNDGCNPGIAEIVADLVTADLLAMAPGERLWKLYCFRTPDHASHLRHRIYTKQKPDGRLALVTFAAHDPAGPDSGRSAVRSGIARVPDLSAADLDNIIDAVRRQAQAAASACEELDLSSRGAFQQQSAWLQANA